MDIMRNRSERLQYSNEILPSSISGVQKMHSVLFCNPFKPDMLVNNIALGKKLKRLLITNQWNAATDIMWYSKRQKVKISYFLYTTGIKLNMLSNNKKKWNSHNYEQSRTISMVQSHSCCIAATSCLHTHLYRSYCQIQRLRFLVLL